MATRTPNRANRPLLERWARLTHRRRGRVMAVWAVSLAALIVAWSQFGGSYATSFTLPGSETQEATDLLKAHFPQRSGDSADLVFQAPAGVNDPAIKARIEALLVDVRKVPGVTGVDSPYDQPGFIAPGGTIARTSVQWAKADHDTDLKDIQTFVDLTTGASGNGLAIEPGGGIARQIERSDFGSEAFGLIAAVFILLIAFGSVIAMGLPVGAAIFGLGTGFGILALLARIAPLPEFVPQFAAMIGIGVGIDYSLLVVTRFREGLHTGHDVEDSIAIALTTAGRSVIFAGIVVVIAFLGLFAMGLPFIAAMGSAGAIVVAVSVLVALTLTPALLSLSGRRIDSLQVPFLHSTEGVDPSSGWFKYSSAIQRHPLPYCVGAAALLLGMALPVLSMNLGFSDNGNNSTSTHSRRAYDLLTEGFGRGFNGQFLAIVDFSKGGSDRLPAIEEALKSTPGVVQVSRTRLNEAKDIGVIAVIPSTSPQDSKTGGLVTRIRETVVPAAVGSSGARVLIGGQTAASVDMGDRIATRLPFLFLGVIGLSFVLLMAVFRSVVVALKAAVMNLLSIGASYGVLVAVFQWGWLSSVLGIEKGPVETFLPMMLFAILFGLSMDYEVFLISRIREEYVRSGNNATAISHGVAATARVITAAAAIMVTVFIGFVFGDDRIIKEFGIGLATAIFVDATIVRLILVPATMELLGDANWWLPRWLDRALPHIDLDGSSRGTAPLPQTSATGGGGE